MPILTQSSRPGATVVALALLAWTAGTVPAEAVDSPQLASISYVRAPYLWADGSSRHLAEVSLSAPAVGDTSVSLHSSSMSTAHVPSQVTVPDGQVSAAVWVTGLQAGFATIGASHGVSEVLLEPQLEVAEPDRTPGLESVAVEPLSVQPGDAAAGTLVLDFLAPPGGTSVSLSADSDRVQLAESVTVPHDSDRVTFEVPTTTGADSSVTIIATLDGVDRTAALTLQDTIAPDTQIDAVAARHKKRRAVIRFSANEAGVTFRCRLDSGKKKACSSPHRYQRLTRGRHKVTVWAVDAAGNPDKSPASAVFRIRRR